MNSTTRVSPPSAAVTPNRVCAKRRPDGALLEIRQRRRQGARLQRDDQILHLVAVDAVDLTVVGDAALDGRRVHHAIVEHDRKTATDVRLREGTEPHGGVLLQGERHGRRVVLVERGLGAAQVAAGDSRDLLNNVEHCPASASA
jgi:hypothetical protein